jgi:FtsH-binding integral membrane protein
MSRAYASSSYDILAAEASVSERMGFIRRTYLHLGGAISVFILLEAIFLQINLGTAMLGMVANVPGGFGWLVFLGLFMVVSWVAESWANSSTSRGMQYAGLGLFVVAEALIFAPLMTVAHAMDPWIPAIAGATTLAMFAVLSAFVFITRADFSFLRSFLMIAGLAFLGVIMAAVIFQFALGPILSVVGVALAVGYILYHTSNVLHHYGVQQHVAASLALFASVALLLWYVIRLFMAFDD